MTESWVDVAHAELDAAEMGAGPSLLYSDDAAIRFLQKFHRETDCGNPEHWAECEAFTHYLLKHVRGA